MAFRAKSPVRARSEISTLARRWSIKRIVATDNILAPAYLERVLPGLANLDLDIFYETKANLKEHQVAILARCGVRTIQPGIEGLSSRTLALMKKGVRRHQNIEVLKWCRTYGLEVIWLYLYGLPGEHAEDYVEDASLMAKIMHLQPPRALNPVVLDRFSPLYEKRRELGIDPVRPMADIALAYRGLSADNITKLCYHFEGDIPGLAPERYLPQLGAALCTWLESARRDASLYRFVSTSATLVIDGRGRSLKSYVLFGGAHRVHLHAHYAAADLTLMQAYTEQGQAQQGLARDFFAILQVAGALASTLIDMEDEMGFDEVIAALDEAGLIVRCDDLWLAVACDLIDPLEAERRGLLDLALACARPDILDPAAARRVA
jgi:hypothetical protein